MLLKTIKSFFVAFEGDPEKDGRTKFRRVSGDRIKPMDHSEEIREFVNIEDVLPLFEAVDKLMKSKWFMPHENDWENVELVKYRLSLWKDTVTRRTLGL